MTTPIDVAMNRLSELKAEMAELETFIKVYYRLYPQEKLSSILPNGPMIRPPAVPVDNSVDKPVERHGALGPRGPRRMVFDTPNESALVNAPSQPDAKEKLRNAREVFGDIFERLIREVQRPLTRGEMLERIAELPDAPPLNSGDNSKYLGTLLWRNRHRFRNLPGHGYWLKDRPYAPAGYDPKTDTETKSLMESEAGFAEPPTMPSALTADLCREYNGAVREVSEARERGEDENQYADAMERARLIAETFPEVKGGQPDIFS